MATSHQASRGSRKAAKVACAGRSFLPLICKCTYTGSMQQQGHCVNLGHPPHVVSLLAR